MCSVRNIRHKAFPECNCPCKSGFANKMHACFLWLPMHNAVRLSPLCVAWAWCVQKRGRQEFRDRPHDTVLSQKEMIFLASGKYITLIKCLGRGSLFEMWTEGFGADGGGTSAALSMIQKIKSTVSKSCRRDLAFETERIHILRESSKLVIKVELFDLL